MILIKVLTKTKYLSFHFAFICWLCAVSFAPPPQNPLLATQTTTSLSMGMQKFNMHSHFVFEYLKISAGERAQTRTIYYERQRSLQCYT